jgi:single-stranded-DNA-specific exonuclease
LHEVTYTDGELLANEITLETAVRLSQCAPWGQAFPEPVFEGNFEVDQVRHIGKENEHVRFILKASSYQQVVAIAFNYSLPEWLMVGNKARFLYRLSVNEYKDVRSVQMIISDIVKAS